MIGAYHPDDGFYILFETSTEARQWTLAFWHWERENGRDGWPDVW